MQCIYDKDARIKGKPSDLVEKPLTVLIQDFDEAAVKQFVKDFEEASNTGQNIIPVMIDSYGGTVYSLLAIIDVIKRSTKPVATICLGKSMSCGAVLLASGTPGYRFATPSSTIMLHDLSKFSWGKLEDLRTDLAECDRLSKLVFQDMAKNCGHKDRNYFIKQFHARKNCDWFLSPKQAKQHKIIDHIATPNFEVSLSLDIKLGYKT